ncbi:MAG: SDR family oxidoreductase [Planctomycetota bacterium]
MADDLFQVSGQVVLVSGGTRGIGRGMAEAFTERGAKVIVTGRNAKDCEATANEIGGDSVGIACDVAQKGQIDALVERVYADFGRVDTLINVAGVNRRKPALDISEDDYDFVMDINLKGAFLLSTAVGARMCEDGGGRQINVTSLNTDRPLKNVSPYAMSKAGMGHMTRSLALEWGDRGVNVNAISPGFILTDLTRKLWSDETMMEWGRKNTPQRRLGEPKDLVGTALFLASEASAFLTGQVLYVDGGFTAGWAWPIPE